MKNKNTITPACAGRPLSSASIVRSSRMRAAESTELMPSSPPEWKMTMTARKPIHPTTRGYAVNLMAPGRVLTASFTMIVRTDTNVTTST